MGRFLKEYGKADKSAAGKMMIQMGKSLIYSSQQEIALRPPLLRLYQVSLSKLFSEEKVRFHFLVVLK